MSTVIHMGSNLPNNWHMGNAQHFVLQVRNMNERRKDTRHGVESSSGMHIAHDNKKMNTRMVTPGMGELQDEQGN